MHAMVAFSSETVTCSQQRQGHKAEFCLDQLLGNIQLAISIPQRMLLDAQHRYTDCTKSASASVFCLFHKPPHLARIFSHCVPLPLPGPPSTKIIFELSGRPAGAAAGASAWNSFEPACGAGAATSASLEELQPMVLVQNKLRQDAWLRSSSGRILIAQLRPQHG